MESELDAVSIEKTFKASIEKVWNAWTEPDLIKQWWGSDPNGRVLEAKTDVRPGGNFEITFQDADLTKHTCFGIYKDVQPFSRLTFTWMWKSEPGVESFVTLLLSTEGEFTKMLFEHRNLGTESKHGYLNGWQDTFMKLEARGFI